MNEEMMQQLVASASRLAQAAEALEGAVMRLDAQQESMYNQIAHIRAAVDEGFHSAPEGNGGGGGAVSFAVDEIRQLRQQVDELNRTNTELRAQSGRLSRRTLPPMVNALLSKSGAGTDDPLDRESLDKALQSLSIEQRIAVKAEMARAGLIT